MSYAAKKELNLTPEKIQNLAIYVILAAFIGGKLLFYLEKPDYYFSSWDRMVNSFRQGFVFYGSLIFAVPVAIWYFRKEKWPFWPIMDRLAITAALVHFFGRFGCFFAGCCYGKPTGSEWGITFTHPETQAEPMHTALHPTQLYEAGFILLILFTLWMFKRHKRFEGQLFFIYLIMYAIGRGIIEIFRGDIRRGFVIEDILSHSQFISIILITVAAWIYLRMHKKAGYKTRKS
jgi:phosphatidylglycerol:prolipoprotein diacylglycerol transferase